MVFFKLLVFLLLTFLGVLSAEDNVEVADVEDVRDAKEYKLETWRAVEKEGLDTSGWIPQDTPSENHQTATVKRRRLRKRKRRPSINDQNAKLQDRLLYFPARRQQPLNQGLKDDTWVDMEQESPKQAVNRRRVIPSYPQEEEPEIVTQKQENSNPLSAVIRFEGPTEETKPRTAEKIRDPFEALKEAEEKQKTPEEIKQSPSNLKSLLKKTGTISLSEILQQKNLTLTQLLTGNVEAISALTTPPVEPTEVMPSIEPTKYQRIPPSERKKFSERVSQQSSDEIEEKELLEAQRKRLALLQAHKENKVYLGVSHIYKVATEPVTERRIFVPSHPKHYSTTSYKPIIFQNVPKTQTYKNEIENSISKSSNTIKPIKKLPITSAKLQTKTTKKTTTTIPPNAILINVEEILKKAEQMNDEPLQISLNFDEDSSKSSEEMFGAGEEILEMLKNPIYKEKLSRILRERNMTFQELVEQRERGSSQLHLADIFHNKTREPEPIEEPFVGVIIKEEYLDNPREQKSLKLEEETNEEAVIPNIIIKEEESKEEITTRPYEEKKIAPLPGFGKNNSFNYAAIMPFWKQFHPDVYNRFYQEGALEEVQRIEEIDNKLSDNINDKFNVELTQKNYHLDEESIFDIPSGIKSALIASFAIVALSLFMFLTILLVFKWTQRKKTKLNYTGSLSGIKIKSPILEMPRRGALRTFVCETLGRRTKFYKSNLQSMSDAWEDKKQKF